MVRHVGLDVHKRVVEACFLNAAGQVVQRERFELSRSTLETFIRTQLRPGDQVALETTTNAWAVAAVLRPHVTRVVVSNPMATKAIASAKVKTDKVDALVLAQLLRCDYLPEVWPPDERTQELRRLTGRRSGLVGQSTQLKNRLHSVLAQRLIAPEKPQLFSAAGRAWLESVELDEEARLLVDSDLRLLAAVERELEVLDELLAKKAYAHEQVKLLMTLPGVDVAVAQAVLAALGDIGRFHDADQAASYLGLTPRTRQSATRCYQGPISKAGNSQARWMLVQAAHHVARHPGPLGHFFRRLAKKKSYNVAIVATARKLAVIAWHMLTKNEPYRYAVPRSTEDKLRRLRVRVTGERRKTGPKNGAFATAKLDAGQKSRTIKPLAQVYQEEHLPPLASPPAGEARVLSAPQVAAHAARIAAPQVIPHRSGRRAPRED
jgi:transposase